jgi:hypothetical protein
MILRDKGEDLCIKMPELHHIQKELQYNSQYFAANKLYYSSKWYPPPFFEFPLNQ